jgi:hypothetical protein
MSRLTEPAILDGDDIDAASINDRYTQFSQPGALNAFNTRDGAFDLPHFKRGNDAWLAPDLYETTMGWNLWKHSSYHTRIGQTTGAAPYTVLDSVGATDVLDFGPLGVAVAPTDILRVYWDLSVRARWEGTRPWTGGALTFTVLHSGGGGASAISNGYGCWAFWLEWDITDNTLSNFVEVPGQGDFNTVVTGVRGGNALTNCGSTSITPAIIEDADVVEDGRTNGSVLVYETGWSSVDGAWHYIPTGGTTTTVYGVRVVYSGPFGAHNQGGVNYLVRNDAVADDARLDQQAGQINALHMRLG